MVRLLLNKVCILLLLAVGELTVRAEQSVIYVVPSDDPQTTECSVEHCPTLNELIKESQHDHHYFRPNTNIILLAGNHTVSRKVTYYTYGSTYSRNGPYVPYMQYKMFTFIKLQ